MEYKSQTILYLLKITKLSFNQAKQNFGMLKVL